MKTQMIYLVIIILTLSALDAQELVSVDGAITISSTDNPRPEGAIRWNGTDFQAWKGSEWVTLTGEKFIRDIDNHKYAIVKIGDQVWMKENLRTTHYNNGNAIPLVTDAATWSALTTPAYTWYENTGSDYGALYNFHVVSSSHNVCPVGWHVPSEEDWTSLINHLGGTGIAGGSLKESGLAHWAHPNIAGTNDSGFTGLPGGYRKSLGTFFFKGQFGFWWSSKENSVSKEAQFYSLLYNDLLINVNTLNKNYGLSIRCVKD